jgi:hypothetical protein
MVLPGVVVPPTKRFAFHQISHISFKSVLPGERGSLVQARLIRYRPQAILKLGNIMYRAGEANAADQGPCLPLRMQEAVAVPGVSSHSLQLSISKAPAKIRQVRFLFVHSLYFVPHDVLYFLLPAIAGARPD